MTGHRKWAETREGHRNRATDEARSASRAALQKKLSDHAESLGDLRRARQMTQQQLAMVMRVSQAQISRVENQADLYLSTLRSYIEAMGGELQIRVAFPGTDWTEVTIGDVTDAEVQSTNSEELSNSIPDVYWHPGISDVDRTNAPGILRIYLTNTALVDHSPDVTPAIGWWKARSDLQASSSARGFVVRKTEGEQPAVGQTFYTWRTAADPLIIPADSDSFVSSAEFKEK